MKDREVEIKYLFWEHIKDGYAVQVVDVRYYPSADGSVYAVVHVEGTKFSAKAKRTWPGAYFVQAFKPKTPKKLRVPSTFRMLQEDVFEKK
jgi:hypothetical protein